MTTSPPLSHLQTQVVQAHPGRQVFIAGSGAGKTTVLAARAAWMISQHGLKSGEVLVLAPSYRAARTVQRLARQRLGGLPAPEATSFHSLAGTLLRRHYRKLGYEAAPRLVRTAELRQLLRQLLAAEEPALWGPYAARLESTTLRLLAEDVVMGAAENVLTQAQLEELAQQLGHGTPLPYLAAFYSRYRIHLRHHGQVDYGTQLLEALRLLREHTGVAARYQRAYRCLLVDECEQANLAQTKLLAALLGPETDLLAAGDPNQATNSYQGGSPTHLLGLAERLRALELRSDEDHRSMRSLQRARKALFTPVSTQPTNETQTETQLDEEEPVPLRVFGYEADEARWLAAEVARQVRSGVPAAEIAIICRKQGTPLLQMVSEELDRRGVPTSGAAGNLTHPLLRASFDVLRFLATDVDCEAPLLRLLDSPLAALPPFGTNELRRIAAQEGRSVPELLDEGWEQLKLDEALRTALLALQQRLASLATYTTFGVSATLWQIWRQFPAFAADAREDAKATGVFAVLLNNLQGIEEAQPDYSLQRFLEQLDRGDFDQTLAVPTGEGGVSIITAHAAKGGQWDVVFVPGLYEDGWPLRRSPLDLIAPLLLPDLLPPEQAQLPPAEASRRAFTAASARHIAEDRRALYLAMGRARRSLHLSYSRFAMDGGTSQLPSRFLTAASDAFLLIPGSWQADLPLDVPGTVAHYRSGLHSADPLERAQAVYALDQLRRTWPLAVDPSRWWQNVAETSGAAPPFPDGSLRLSASRLGQYANCPQAYQYQYFWGLQEESGVAATIGTTLHAVLEDYHRPGNTLPRSYETLLALLNRHFRAEDYPYRPVARQARKALEKMLDLYYSRYGLDGPALAVEQSFRFDLDGHTFRGYIDRVDRRPDGTLELIDYKSGTVMSKSAAEADLQLALYDLAFAEDDSLKRLGRPTLVTYLYPKGIKTQTDGRRSYQPSEGGREYLKQRVRYYINAILSERFPSHGMLRREFSDLDAAELERLMAGSPCRFCHWKWLCPQQAKGDSDD